ncbi:hypothetical protein [Leptospira noguchii]|nr:hypothetical protein [Leptospira noguchii]UOG54807.1 hypothetical protein MAL09_19500 [Leptospira noguchii]
MSHFNYKICERFAPIFLRRTHVNLMKLGIHAQPFDPRIQFPSFDQTNY